MMGAGAPLLLLSILLPTHQALPADPEAELLLMTAEESEDSTGDYGEAVTEALTELGVETETSPSPAAPDTSFEVDYDETLELNTDYNTVDTGASGDTAAQPRNLDIAAVAGEVSQDRGLDPATTVLPQPSGRGWYYVIPGPARPLARPRPRLLLYQLPYFHYSLNIVNTGL